MFIIFIVLEERSAISAALFGNVALLDCIQCDSRRSSKQPNPQHDNHAKDIHDDRIIAARLWSHRCQFHRMRSRRHTNAGI